MDSLKIISEIVTQDNIFFSPHSLHQALMVVYLGARGATETSLKQALHIPTELSKVDVQRFYAFENTLNQIRKENSTTNYEYEIANRLWVKNSTRLKSCMLSIFDQELEKVDFWSDPEAARNKINQWVSDKTKGNIQDLIPSQGITQDTDLVLSNAVYFKGLWKSRFNRENTKKSIFYQAQNNATLASFMYQKGTFNHMVSEELGAHVLQLPYMGDEVSMFIFLPPFATARSLQSSTQDGLIQLIQRISSTESGLKELREILDEGMQAKPVEVQIPKFSLEQELPMLQLASGLGIEEILTPNGADLRGFVEDNEESLHIGDAVHRAKIEISEEGTTAAAATALFSFRSSRPDGPAIFHANHPFLYLIYDHSNRNILFNGIFRKPKKPDNGGVV
ncbi:serine protease inhibitor 88Ea-like isoform X2 [Belonocnema kinseyi]|nr:serine protease inhibitor 88Ea-like isoform X2 [Belonocnema kinseyi]